MKQKATFSLKVGNLTRKVQVALKFPLIGAIFVLRGLHTLKATEYQWLIIFHKKHRLSIYIVNKSDYCEANESLKSPSRNKSLILDSNYDV